MTALIFCPECKSNISGKAIRCPSCGFPILKNEYNKYKLENVLNNNK
jgi:DNA-directed RNA polymerase subunit RPC12/RpoP